MRKAAEEEAINKVMISQILNEMTDNERRLIKMQIFFKYVTKRCRRATGNITSSGIEAGEKNFNESKAGEAKLEAFTKLTKILLDSKRYEI